MKLLKPAILSMALLTILMNASIVPVISQIYQAFPDVDATLIKMNLSLPALTSILFSLIAGKAAQYIPKKHILIAALLLYSVPGILSGWVNSIWAMLALRAVMGGGSGMIAPLVTDLIAYFFNGEERVKMIGYSNASSNMAGVIIPLLSGWLAGFNWRYAFFVYGIGLLVLITTWFFIPITPLTRNHKDTRQFSQSKPVWRIVIMNFFTLLLFYALPANLSIYVQEESLGSPSTAALLISISTLTSTLIGMSFSFFYRKFGNRLLFMGTTFCGAGFFLISRFPGILALIMGEIIIGIGLGALFPYFSLKITQATSGEKTTTALALLSSSFAMGIFLSPIFFIGMQQVSGLHTIRGEFFISAILFTLFTIFIIIQKEKTPISAE